MNYEEDMEIDVLELDEEWNKQATLMLQYTKHAAECRKKMDKSKEDLDVTRASLDQAIRKKPEHFKIEKITEGAIGAAILLAEPYKKKYNLYLEARYEYDMAQGAVRALDHKKDALENYVRLHGQQYFAGPKVPRNLEDIKKKKVESAQESIKIKRK
jgi:hypothetical protein